MFDSFKEQLAVGRALRREHYDEAIEIYTRGLNGTVSDVPNLEMIAFCHLWAGRPESAIVAANKVLALNGKSFQALSMLGKIYARQGNHEIASKFVRLGLEAYPSDLPPIPSWMLGVVRLLGFIAPRFRKNLPEIEATLRDPSSPDKEWFVWAKKYLEWYDATYGQDSNPKNH